MKNTKIASKTKPSPIEQQKFELDRSRHFHQLLQYEESKISLIVTWLFTSQGLLGASYAYLQHETAAAISQNRATSFHILRVLARLLPWAAVFICIVLLFALWSVTSAQTEIRQKRPTDSLMLSSQHARIWPVAAVIMATLFSAAWLIVPASLP